VAAAALFVVAAADWLSGTCLMVGAWRFLRSRLGSQQHSTTSSTPLADEAEAWLQRQQL